jgi:hypothetical protein
MLGLLVVEDGQGVARSCTGQQSSSGRARLKLDGDLDPDELGEAGSAAGLGDDGVTQ